MVKIYTDGSQTQICFVIEGQEPIVRPVKPDGERATVNEGEYLAVIHALQEAKNQGLQEVEVWSDSELMVKQMTEGKDGRAKYQTKEIRLQQLQALVRGLMVNVKATFNWLPREQNLAGLVLEQEEKKKRRTHVSI